MENTEPPKKKGNDWTDFVKDWAEKTNTTYMVAIKDPAIKQAYKDSKKTKKKLVIVDNFTKLKDDAVAMAEAIDPPADKKKAGRPSKYATDEERKEAKRLKTLASNKKKREEMSKKNKAGTMTAEEKEIWDDDTAKNVERTIEYRARQRAGAIARFTLIFNKLRDYIIDNEKEFLENFEKDPYDILYGDKNWKPTGENQERAVELFGNYDGGIYGREIDEKALTPAEIKEFNEPKIPNFESGIQKARDDIEGLKRKLSSKVSAAQRKGLERTGRETTGMMKNDPVEKRRREEKQKKEREEREDFERKREEEYRNYQKRVKEREIERGAADEKERQRRRDIGAEGRAKENRLTEMFFQRFIGSGLAGGGRGDEPPKPNNPELYAKAKEIADKKFSKPSAYKSGFIVKKYKEMGGTYSGKKPSKKGIAGWFKENWKDVAGLEYPVYRPTKRISKDTPLTPDEIDPKNLQKQIRLKQKIKGDSNLPAFKGKGRNFVSLVDNGFWG